MRRDVLVVLPVYGEHEVTHAVLGDLRREADRIDVVVVDNGGDYPELGWEQVVRPGRNLGWAGGSNLGVEAGRSAAHRYVVWLNNDTRLSRSCIGELRRTARVTGAGVVAPVYDCHWLHQRVPRLVEAEFHQRAREHRLAPFVDGTCLLVPTATIDAIGLLDDETFAPLGWGAEIDYSLRARHHGFGVVVTRAAFVHHVRAVTAQALFGDYEAYVASAYPVSLDGLERKWGPGWRALAGIGPDEQTPTFDSLPRVRGLAGARRRLSAAS